MFNLRHGIEVALKWHIRYAGGSVPKNAKHDLEILVGTFQQLAELLDPEEALISVCVLDCVSELAAIDPRSTAFRYSAELDGSSTNAASQHWDLRHLYFYVSDLLLWFDDLSSRIERVYSEELLNDADPIRLHSHSIVPGGFDVTS